MRDERAIKLVEILMEAGGYVPQDFLCAQLGIKERTLRNLIIDTRDQLEKDTGSSIKLKNNQGYRLIVEDEKCLRLYLSKEKQKARERAFLLPISQEDRISYEIRRLLNATDGVKEEDIADEIFISKSTIAQDLRLVRKILAGFSLSLENRAGKGLCIAGQEENVRSCINEYIFNEEYADSDCFLRDCLGQFSLYYRNKVASIVQDVTRKHDFAINDVNFKGLVVHILIALYRVESGSYVHVEPGDQKIGSLEFSISEEIRARINEATGIDMPEVETQYIAMHFMGIRKLTENDVNLILPETMNLVRSVLTEILNEYGVDLFFDIDLFTMLCVHVQPMLDRLRSSRHMINPMLPQIKQEYANAYDMAVFAGNVISRKLDKPVAEEEIGYLALHFQLAMEKRVKEKKFNILTVCASGLGTAKFLEHKIRARFHETIGKVDAMGMREAEGCDLSKYDLVLTSVPVSLHCAIPVLQVGYLLDDADLNNIEVTLFNKDADIEEIRRYFHPDLFFSDVAFESKEEALQFLIGKLKEKSEVPNGFMASVLEREALASTNMGKGVALPHPMRAMVQETRVAVALLKHPLQWGLSAVNIVLLLAIRKDAGTSYSLFNHVLLSLISNEESLARIQQERTLSAFLNEVEKQCRSSKSEKQESIFQ